MPSPGSFKPGETVYHKLFGEGIVVGPSTSGAGFQVNFASQDKLKSLLPEAIFRDEVSAAAFKSISPKAKQRSIVHQHAAEMDFTGLADIIGKPLPQRDFLDERGLIPMSNVTLLYGDGGTGKSLVSLQLALAVAGTHSWLGRGVRHETALYVSAEDDEDEVHIRVKEIAAADGIDLSKIDNLGFAFLAGEDAVLAVEAPRTGGIETTPLFVGLQAAVTMHRPSLLIIDNLADAFSGNENAKTPARQFIGKLRGIAIRHKCAVVILAHPSQSGMNTGTGTSGNTAWSNSVRSRLYFSRVLKKDGDSITEDDPDARVLRTMKSNYGRTGGEIQLRWEAGRFVAVEEPRQAAGDPLAQATKAERVFMHLLHWHLRHSKFVSPNKSVSYAPSVFSRHKQAEGVKVRQFEDAMNALLDQGRIEIFTHGSPTNRRQHIGLPLSQSIED